MNILLRNITLHINKFFEVTRVTWFIGTKIIERYNETSCL
jgi:hypothetical protein